MSRILVVYFSRTGYTRRVAEEVARDCKADLEAIDESKPRSGLLGYWRSAREALGKRLVPIAAAKRDPAAYDIVVLGTPVWAGALCSPMRSYIEAHKGAFKRVAFLATQGGSGAPKVFASMSELCGQPPLATLALSDREIDRAQYRETMARFDATLGAT
jgi:flavodoxin